jgi:hypothetical protein
MTTQPTQIPAPPGGVRGSRIVWIGLAVVLLVSAFVIVRIVQTSGPAPDPQSIPERPQRTSP